MSRLSRKHGGLRDDGTMDTVIGCDRCGEQMRYTYSPGPGDDDSVFNDEESAKLYDDWVRGCIDDFDETHVEESPECYEEQED